MDDVAQRPASDRADLFDAAASRRGIMPAIMEKDFWVCWALRRIFTLGEPPAQLLFKGGTSLSKVFNAIARFSEDVDLAFDRADLGFGGDDDPMVASSGKKRDRALSSLEARCVELVRGTFFRLLLAQFAASLARVSDPWDLVVSENEPMTLLFHYPRKRRSESASYVQPMVRLEFGARSDHWPVHDATITPYVAEHFPDQVANPECRVRVLSGPRTFWEKATILHQWYHASEDKPLPARQSRHYYDLSCLSGHRIADDALSNLDLLAAVARHKSVFFASSWSKYELARPGTLRLLPRPSRRRALEADYARMREMIFGEYIPFDSILSSLEALEARVNQHGQSNESRWSS